jgi:tRNA uridine 5-carboxymethylaminomethyl modification enzyme
LRADNADVRLTPAAIKLGLARQDRTTRFQLYQSALDDERRRLEQLTVTPKAAAEFGISLNQDGQRRSAYTLLSYPEIGLKELQAIWPELNSIDERVAEALEIEAGYAVYLDRQKNDIDSVRRDEYRAIPLDFDFNMLSGLSNELKLKLSNAKPRNIAQASKVDGMTPAALALILALVRKNAVGGKVMQVC